MMALEPVPPPENPPAATSAPVKVTFETLTPEPTIACARSLAVSDVVRPSDDEARIGLCGSGGRKLPDDQARHRKNAYCGFPPAPPCRPSSLGRGGSAGQYAADVSHVRIERRIRRGSTVGAGTVVKVLQHLRPARLRDQIALGFEELERAAGGSRCLGHPAQELEYPRPTQAAPQPANRVRRTFG